MNVKDWIVTAGMLALVYRLAAYFWPKAASDRVALARREVRVPVPLRQTVPVVVRSARRERRQTELLVKFFIASEAFFFLALIVAYVYYRNISDVIAVTDDYLDAQKTGLFTLALITSSGTLWWGRRSLRQGKPERLIVGLLVTIGLGAVFLYGQGREYAGLFQQEITIGSNIFGSAFFTLTGFHALHVLVGLLVLMIMLVRSLLGDFQGPQSGAITGTELYWHFVDGVWIMVFTVVYLIPLL